jgi:hypothetical protein
VYFYAKLAPTPERATIDSYDNLLNRPLTNTANLIKKTEENNNPYNSNSNKGNYTSPFGKKVEKKGWEPNSRKNIGVWGEYRGYRPDLAENARCFSEVRFYIQLLLDFLFFLLAVAARAGLPKGGYRADSTKNTRCFSGARFPLWL